MWECYVRQRGLVAYDQNCPLFVSPSQSRPRRHKRCYSRVARGVGGVVKRTAVASERARTPLGERGPPFLRRSHGCYFVIAILPRGFPPPPTRESAHRCHTVATPLFPRNGLAAGGQTSPREREQIWEKMRFNTECNVEEMDALGCLAE